MEKYNLKIHIGVNDLFNSSMNNLTNSKSHYVNIIFTFTALVLLIYLFINNMIYNIGMSRIILLILCCSQRDKVFQLSPMSIRELM